jgi:glycosyltransferase involved in cell wall biosynthesis
MFWKYINSRKMENSLSIIIYGYNEGENAARTVAEALELVETRGLDGEVIFVDDGSTDHTSRALEDFTRSKRIIYLSHEYNKGIGSAIKTGLAAARKAWITALPADGQVPPGELAKILDAAAGVTLVVSRFPRRFKTADDLVRRFFSIGFHAFCQVAMGGGWGMDGVWMARADRVRDLDFLSRTFVANIEIPVRLIRSGETWRRVDLEVRPRAGGRSKIFSAGRILRVGAEILKAGMNIS